ncbi:glycerophosphodiester phosphodiesterase [Candidatus Woesearchaeota archaeon]|nr:glycerophosphodiester phosphodiesterase [Candidatus Woesearchaeota archaeon]MCF7901066.1 glycerophosphodiester phosphodiesterase [Candidatus Woesearchaeota archaeon]MCF8013617.1 glycerophosphodiester phosphodiesterase [Candidatus Woesearchaeota archaeon]
MKIFAHRGSSGEKLENSFSAFNLAVKQKADFIEFDVRLTKDKVPVVIHNPHVSDVSEAKGFVRNMTSDEIKKLKLLNDEHIPFLEDVLKKYKGKIKFNIEVKEVEATEFVLELVKKYSMEKDVIISSDYPDVSKIVKKKNKNIKTGLVYRSFSPFFLNRMFIASSMLIYPLTKYFIVHKTKKCGADYIHPNYIYCSKNNIDYFHKQGFEVNVWTVNSEKLMKKMINNGVDAIMSNYYSIFKKSLKK